MSKDQATVPQPAHHAPMSDYLVTWIVVGVVLATCLISYLLAMRLAVPGAPGAPLG